MLARPRRRAVSRITSNTGVESVGDVAMARRIPLVAISRSLEEAFFDLTEGDE